MIEVESGIARYKYKAYAHQKAFHESACKHRLLGGAAGPGKTLALLEDHMLACEQFSMDEGPQVHTLIVRRTHPKLEATVITRFREKIPRELYREFNETKGLVTWHNGSTTKFGAMQHESDVWGYQGQWYKIAYDELTEFTFSQWQNISAWNRCPVSKRSTKDGATNPIGIGAMWVEDLFVKHKSCTEMDAKQKAMYAPEDYGYFPATYLDNPIYAKDAQYIANLDSYPDAIANALKMGVWGVAGGYFEGAWDEAVNIYDAADVEMKPWWKRWLGGDWGFDHNSAIYWLCQDDAGIVRVYRELVTNRKTAEELAGLVVANSGSIYKPGDVEHYEMFPFAHDAFAQKTDENPTGLRMSRVLQKAGLCAASPSTKDKLGREQIIYDMLKERVIVGSVENPETHIQEAVSVPRLQIERGCENIIRTIPKAPRAEKNSEEIADFLGDDPIAGLGYGLYGMFGRPRRKPVEVRVAERIVAAGVTDPTSRAIWAKKFLQEEKRVDGPVRIGGKRGKKWWR